MWKAITGKKKDDGDAGSMSGRSSSLRKKKRPESVISSSSSRVTSRGWERPASSRASIAESSSAGPSAYATAPSSRVDAPSASHKHSLTESAIRTLSAKDDEWEDEDRKSERRSKRSDSHERKKRRSERSRSRSRSRDRKDKTEIKRSKSEKSGEKESRGKSRSFDVVDEPRASRRGMSGSGPDLAQYEAGFVGPQQQFGPRPQRTSSYDPAHIPEQFPGQNPSQYAAPAFQENSEPRLEPPTRADSYGLAADYYGDAGESVQRQPGVRPRTPIIIGAETNGIGATAEFKPPEETGQGSAAEFFSGADFGETEPVPEKPSRPSTKPSASSGKRPTTSRLSSAAIASAATAAASTALEYRRAHTSRPTSESVMYNEANYYAPPGSSTPPIYVSAGTVAAGLAAYEKHEHPERYTESAANVEAAEYADSQWGGSQRTQRPPLASHRSLSIDRDTGIERATGTEIPHEHEHKGPIAKLKDGFLNLISSPEDVRRMEEYTEYIGVCRYCFDPNSSANQAPRKHHYHGKRSIENMRKRSNDSLRRSSEYGRSSRIDKESRYYASDNSRRGNKAGAMVGAGLAGYGLAKAGQKILGDNKDFDDTYSVKSGHRESSRRTRRSRSRSQDRRSNTSRGVVGRKVEENDYEVVRTTDGKLVRRLRRRSRSRSRDTKDALLGVAAGAAIGASVAGRSHRSREHSPQGAFVRHHERSRSHSSGSPGLGEIFGFSDNKSRRRSRRSPNGSYYDISRSERQQSSGGMLGGFFTSPPERKRKERRKKQKGFFNFGNASSSSTGSDLAFGSGHGRRLSPPRRTRRKKSDEHLDATLLGIGATAAALAAAQKGGRVNKRSSRPELMAVRERKDDRHDSRMTREQHHGHGQHGEDEEWESASEFDDDASVSSGLAFGDFDVKGKRPTHRQSIESLASQSSGTVKWGWRWGGKSKKRRPSSPPQYPPRPEWPITTSLAGAGVAAAVDVYGRPVRSESAMTSQSSLPTTQSMQYIDPMPLSEGASRHSSMPGAFEVESPLEMHRPGPAPLQQPQPIAPMRPAFDTTQPPPQPGYTAPSGPSTFPHPAVPSGPRRTQSSPGAGNFVRDAALIGGAAAITAGILATTGGKDKDREASNVRFDLTERQARKEERERKRADEDRRRADRARALKEEAERHVREEDDRRAGEARQAAEADRRRTIDRQAAEEDMRRRMAVEREAMEQQEMDRQRERERQGSEAASKREQERQVQLARQQESEERQRDELASRAAAQEEAERQYREEEAERQYRQAEERRQQQRYLEDHERGHTAARALSDGIESRRLDWLREQESSAARSTGWKAPVAAGVAGVAAGAMLARENRDRPEEDYQHGHTSARELDQGTESKRRDFEEQQRFVPPSTEAWEAPVADSTVGAILAGAEHEYHTGDRTREQYAAEAIEPTNEHSGEPLMDDDIFDPDFFKRKRSKSDFDRASNLARKAASRVVADMEDRYNTAPLSQADFFAPKELLDQASAGKTKVADAIGDNDVHVFNVQDIQAGSDLERYLYDSPLDKSRPRSSTAPSRFGDVPRLNVIAPTPPPSSAGSVRGERSAPPSPVVQPEDKKAQSAAGAERRASGKVSWGEDQTHVYDVETPDSHQDLYGPHQEPSSQRDAARNEIVVEAEEPGRGTSKTTYKSDDLPTKDQSRDPFGDSYGTSAAAAEPRFEREEYDPQPQAAYRSPFAETVSDLGFAMDSPGTEGAPPVRGFVEGETDEPTPRDERSPHIPGGFDNDENFPGPPVGREMEELPLSKKDKKKREKAAKFSSFDEFAPETPRAEAVVEEPEPTFEIPLSKKDKKKRDKAAKRGTAFEDDSTPSTPVVEESQYPPVQQPESEAPDYFLSKKDKKKRDKAAKKGYEEASESSTPVAEESETRDLGRADMETEADPFELPLSKKDKKKREKALKSQGLGDVAAAALVGGAATAVVAAAASGEDDEWSSGRKSKKSKGKKNAGMSDFGFGEEEPEVVQPPQVGETRSQDPGLAGDDGITYADNREANGSFEQNEDQNRTPVEEADPFTDFAETKKSKKKSKKRMSDRFNSPAASSPLRSEVAFDDYMGNGSATRNVHDRDDSYQGEEHGEELGMPREALAQIGNAGVNVFDYMERDEAQPKPSNGHRRSDEQLEQESTTNGDGIRGRFTESPEHVSPDRDARSVVSAPVEDESSRRKSKSTKSRRESDYYDDDRNDRDDRSVAASEPVDLYESSRKSKGRSKRDDKDADDTASVMSSRSKHADEDSSKSKKKGGLFGLFSRKSSDIVPLREEPAESVAGDVDDGERKHRKKKKHRDSEYGDDDTRSIASESRHRHRRESEYGDDDSRSVTSESKHRHHRSRSERGDDEDHDRSTSKLEQRDDEDEHASRRSSEGGHRHHHHHREDDDGHRSRRSSEASHKHHRHSDDVEDGGKYAQRETNGQDQDQSFLGERVEDLPPLPASLPQSPVSAPVPEEKVLGSPSLAERDTEAGLSRSMTGDQEPTTSYSRDATAAEPLEAEPFHETINSASSESIAPLTLTHEQAHADDQIPPLPVSQPSSPIGNDEILQRPAPLVRPASSTAVPLRFRRPPGSPGLPKERSMSISSPAVSMPDSPLSAAKSRRPLSKEFKHDHEFRPLYLVESNRKTPDVEDVLPSLPSSRTTSRASSLIGSEEYQSAVEDIGSPESTRNLTIDTSHANEYQPEEGILDSQQTTPKASDFPANAFDRPQRSEPQYYTWDDLEQDERLHEAAAEHDSQTEVADFGGDYPERAVHDDDNDFNNVRPSSPSRDIPSQLDSRTELEHEQNQERPSASGEIATAALVGATAGMIGDETTTLPQQPDLSDVWDDGGERDIVAADREPQAYEDGFSTIAQESPTRPQLSRSASSKKGSKKKGKKAALGTASISEPAVEPTAEEVRLQRERDAQDAVDSWFEPTSIAVVERKKSKRDKRRKGSEAPANEVGSAGGQPVVELAAENLEETIEQPDVQQVPWESAQLPSVVRAESDPTTAGAQPVDVNIETPSTTTTTRDLPAAEDPLSQPEFSSQQLKTSGNDGSKEPEADEWAAFSSVPKRKQSQKSTKKSQAFAWDETDSQAPNAVERDQNLPEAGVADLQQVKSSDTWTAPDEETRPDSIALAANQVSQAENVLHHADERSTEETSLLASEPLQARDDQRDEQRTLEKPLNTMSTGSPSEAVSGNNGLAAALINEDSTRDVGVEPDFPMEAPQIKRKKSKGKKSRQSGLWPQDDADVLAPATKVAETASETTEPPSESRFEAAPRSKKGKKGKKKTTLDLWADEEPTDRQSMMAEDNSTLAGTSSLDHVKQAGKSGATDDKQVTKPDLPEQGREDIERSFDVFPENVALPDIQGDDLLEPHSEQGAQDGQIMEERPDAHQARSPVPDDGRVPDAPFRQEEEEEEEEERAATLATPSEIEQVPDFLQEPTPGEAQQQTPTVLEPEDQSRVASHSEAMTVPTEAVDAEAHAVPEMMESTRQPDNQSSSWYSWIPGSTAWGKRREEAESDTEEQVFKVQPGGDDALTDETPFNTAETLETQDHSIVERPNLAPAEHNDAVVEHGSTIVSADVADAYEAKRPEDATRSIAEATSEDIPLHLVGHDQRRLREDDTQPELSEELRQSRSTDEASMPQYEEEAEQPGTIVTEFSVGNDEMLAAPDSRPSIEQDSRLAEVDAQSVPQEVETWSEFPIKKSKKEKKGKASRSATSLGPPESMAMDSEILESQNDFTDKPREAATTDAPLPIDNSQSQMADDFWAPTPSKKKVKKGKKGKEPSISMQDEILKPDDEEIAKPDAQQAEVEEERVLDLTEDISHPKVSPSGDAEDFWAPPSSKKKGKKAKRSQDVVSFEPQTPTLDEDTRELPPEQIEPILVEPEIDTTATQEADTALPVYAGEPAEDDSGFPIKTKKAKKGRRAQEVSAFETASLVSDGTLDRQVESFEPQPLEPELDGSRGIEPSTSQAAEESIEDGWGFAVKAKKGKKGKKGRQAAGSGTVTPSVEAETQDLPSTLAEPAAVQPEHEVQSVRDVEQSLPSIPLTTVAKDEWAVPVNTKKGKKGRKGKQEEPIDSDPSTQEVQQRDLQPASAPAVDITNPTSSVALKPETPDEVGDHDDWGMFVTTKELEKNEQAAPEDSIGAGPAAAESLDPESELPVPSDAELASLPHTQDLQPPQPEARDEIVADEEWNVPVTSKKGKRAKKLKPADFDPAIPIMEVNTPAAEDQSPRPPETNLSDSIIIDHQEVPMERSFDQPTAEDEWAFPVKAKKGKKGKKAKQDEFDAQFADASAEPERAAIEPDFFAPRAAEHSNIAVIERDEAQAEGSVGQPVVDGEWAPSVRTKKGKKSKKSKRDALQDDGVVEDLDRMEGLESLPALPDSPPAPAAGGREMESIGLDEPSIAMPDQTAVAEFEGSWQGYGANNSDWQFRDSTAIETSLRDARVYDANITASEQPLTNEQSSLEQRGFADHPPAHPLTEAEASQGLSSHLPDTTSSQVAAYEQQVVNSKDIEDTATDTQDTRPANADTILEQTDLDAGEPADYQTNDAAHNPTESLEQDSFVPFATKKSKKDKKKAKKVREDDISLPASTKDWKPNAATPAEPEERMEDDHFAEAAALAGAGAAAGTTLPVVGSSNEEPSIEWPEAVTKRSKKDKRKGKKGGLASADWDTDEALRADSGPTSAGPDSEAAEPSQPEAGTFAGLVRDTPVGEDQDDSSSAFQAPISKKKSKKDKKKTQRSFDVVESSATDTFTNAPKEEHSPSVSMGDGAVSELGPRETVPPPSEPSAETGASIAWNLEDATSRDASPDVNTFPPTTFKTAYNEFQQPAHPDATDSSLRYNEHGLYSGNADPEIYREHPEASHAFSEYTSQAREGAVSGRLETEEELDGTTEHDEAEFFLPEHQTEPPLEQDVFDAPMERSAREEEPTALPGGEKALVDQQDQQRPSQDIDFAATLAAGLAQTGFNPDLVVNDPAFHRRASPPGSFAEADPEEAFATTTRRSKKGRQGRKDRDGVTEENEAFSMPSPHQAEQMQKDQLPADEDDFNATLAKSLQNTGFDTTLLENPSLAKLNSDGAREDPDEFTFSQPKRKKGKKAKRDQAFDEPTDDEFRNVREERLEDFLPTEEKPTDLGARGAEDINSGPANLLADIAMDPSAGGDGRFETNTEMATQAAADGEVSLASKKKGKKSRKKPVKTGNDWWSVQADLSNAEDTLESAADVSPKADKSLQLSTLTLQDQADPESSFQTAKKAKRSKKKEKFSLRLEDVGEQPNVNAEQQSSEPAFLPEEPAAYTTEDSTFRDFADQSFDDLEGQHGLPKDSDALPLQNEVGPQRSYPTSQPISPVNKVESVFPGLERVKRRAPSVAHNEASRELGVNPQSGTNSGLLHTSEISQSLPMPLTRSPVVPNAPIEENEPSQLYQNSNDPAYGGAEATEVNATVDRPSQEVIQTGVGVAGAAAAAAGLRLALASAADHRDDNESLAGKSRASEDSDERRDPNTPTPARSFANLDNERGPLRIDPPVVMGEKERQIARDSGYQTATSPVLQRTSVESAKSMGREPTPARSQESLRSRRSAEPLRISVDNGANWDLPVSKRRSENSPPQIWLADGNSARGIAEVDIDRDLEAEGDEPPSPVESTTKNRTSYLFQSPPVVTGKKDLESFSPLTSHLIRGDSTMAPADEIPRDYFDYGARESRQATTSRESAASPRQDRNLFSPAFDKPNTPKVPLHTIQENSPDEHHATKKGRAISDIGSPDRALKAARRTQTPQQDFRERALSPPAQPSVISRHGPSGMLPQLQTSGSAFQEDRTANSDHTLKRKPSKRVLSDQRSPSVQSNRSASSATRFISPEQMRSFSAASNRTSTPPLRRIDRSLSGDLRAASRRGEAQGSAVRSSPNTIAFEPPPTPPLNDEDVIDQSAARAAGMADIYQGFGDVQGSSTSPTRPPSMRKRQSMHIMDLESRLDQLVEENRYLQEARNHVDQTQGGASHQRDEDVDSQALYEALQSRDLQLQEKDAEIHQIRAILDSLQGELARLTEANGGLTEANRNLIDDANSRYGTLQAEHAHAHEQWQSSSRELDNLRQQHGQLTSGMEAIVQEEIANALGDKTAEIRRLREELDLATEQIRTLQQQIQESKPDDFLVSRDEDYFDGACQKLCQHVQQWILRFSKFSDNRVCRLSSELKDEKIEARLDNAILDGSDVDKLLGDRIKRRDVFMSVVMTMVWEYVFTRYLFGMDREQRQKLKALEKILAEVGPARAVAQWRATTLTLLSKRPAFATQCSLDTEAVAHEIFGALAALLPPPSNMEAQIMASLQNVLRLAVELSIEMRTQRAEYIMLPPLQPEYDTNGDLVRKVHFNASLMNERSGQYNSNEELEQERAIVKIVLFPLVVKKGDESGEGEEEIVVCPAQVLVQGGKTKKVVRVMSGAMEIDDPRRSRQSLVSTAMDSTAF